MFRNFFSVENSIDHMTTEKSHFYFISSMWVNFIIFMYRFEDITSC
jgi:hypothetical protein